jgi:putative hydrolase of the HAD superfamily
VSRPRALLLDALGTLLELEPPVPPLRRALRAALGLEVEPDRVAQALAGEIAHYRAHHLEGRDRRSLEGLRARCTEVLRAGLGPAAASAPAAELQEALLGSLRFAPFPDVAGALARLREEGLRLVVVSNWDCSLPGVLENAGLGELIHATVTSASCGVAKPDPAVFARGLAVAGVTAAQAWHVGDSPHEDVEGARAAGIEAVLVVRDQAAAPPGVRTVRSLIELAADAA